MLSGEFLAADRLAIEIEDKLFLIPFQSIGLEVLGKVILSVENVELRHFNPLFTIEVFHPVVVHHGLPVATILVAVEELDAADALLFLEGKLRPFASVRLGDPSGFRLAIRDVGGAVFAVVVIAAGLDRCCARMIDQARL